MRFPQLIPRDGVRLVGEASSLKFARGLKALASPLACLVLPLLSIVTWLRLGTAPVFLGWKVLDRIELLQACSVILLFLLFHEAMHLAAYFRSGGLRGSIRLRLKGGVLPIAFAKMTFATRPDWRTVATISAAGPMVAFAAALAANVAAAGVPWLYWGTMFSAVAALVNLIPFGGSDGQYLCDAIRTGFNQRASAQRA